MAERIFLFERQTEAAMMRRKPGIFIDKQHEFLLDSLSLFAQLLNSPQRIPSCL